MKLIPHWRQSWKMASMWAYFATVGLLLGVLYAVLTTGERLSYGDMLAGIVALIALQFIGVVGRLIDQGLAGDVVDLLAGDADP